MLTQLGRLSAWPLILIYMARRTVKETSAGGLVLDRQHRAAIIGRHNRRGRLVWSLPKGHVEEGETPEIAAVREISEETGLTARVVATLGVIDFWFMEDRRRIHKTVHHFLLRTEGGELSDADAEVDVVEWVPLAEVQDRLSHSDERKLLDSVSELLVETDFDALGPGE
ncbi:MAG: hypothetical protein RJB01_890 [Actinomycetota bacterium]